MFIDFISSCLTSILCDLVFEFKKSAQRFGSLSRAFIASAPLTYQCREWSCLSRLGEAGHANRCHESMLRRPFERNKRYRTEKLNFYQFERLPIYMQKYSLIEKN